MALVKICPTCNLKNDIDEPQCANCMVDISKVKPVDEASAVQHPVILKKCPSCNEPNPGDVLECRNCSWPLGDSEGIIPATPHEKRERNLVLKLAGGANIRVSHGDVIGRSGTGGEILEGFFMTVSGKHAQITFEQGVWFIEDVGSTNGTYLNNVRIPAHVRMEIRPGQKLSLSRACEMDVGEEVDQ